MQALWVQEVRISKRLSYKKVLGSLNPADVLTKHVPKDLLNAHLVTLGVEMRGGRAESAPTLDNLEIYSEEWEETLIGDDTDDNMRGAEVERVRGTEVERGKEADRERGKEVDRAERPKRSADNRVVKFWPRVRVRAIEAVGKSLPTAATLRTRRSRAKSKS